MDDYARERERERGEQGKKCAEGESQRATRETLGWWIAYRSDLAVTDRKLRAINYDESTHGVGRLGFRNDMRNGRFTFRC